MDNNIELLLVLKVLKRKIDTQKNSFKLGFVTRIKKENKNRKCQCNCIDSSMLPTFIDAIAVSRTQTNRLTLCNEIHQILSDIQPKKKPTEVF